MRWERLLVLPVLALLAPFPAAPQRLQSEQASPPRPVYVRPFAVFVPKAEREGLLARQRASRHDRRSVDDAARLAAGIAAALEKSGYRSVVLSEGAPLPTAGWLVTGAWYALDAQGRILETARALGGGKDPNIEVSVSVADLASNPSVPFIVFGRADALRGQAPPVGWNPWVVAAKFVVGKVQERYDLDALAKQIVDTILANRETVAERARAEKAP